MAETLEVGIYWFAELKQLERARGYDRNRILRQLAYRAGKLIQDNQLNRKQARGMLLSACRINKLAGYTRDNQMYGSSFVLNMIDHEIEKGMKNGK